MNRDEMLQEMEKAVLPKTKGLLEAWEGSREELEGLQAEVQKLEAQLAEKEAEVEVLNSSRVKASALGESTEKLDVQLSKSRAMLDEIKHTLTHLQEKGIPEAEASVAKTKEDFAAGLTKALAEFSEQLRDVMTAKLKEVITIRLSWGSALTEFRDSLGITFGTAGTPTAPYVRDFDDGIRRHFDKIFP